MPELGEKELNTYLERAQAQRNPDVQFTPGRFASFHQCYYFCCHFYLDYDTDESERFKKAFNDPEFRKLFSDYMDELQDPQYREENEAYISQLEKEKKVPEGKELIRSVFSIFLVFYFGKIVF